MAANENVMRPASEQDDEIDLREIAMRLWKRRWWVIASVVLFTALFATVAFLSTKIYRASTVLIPANSGSGGLGESLGGALGSLGGLASLAGINLNSSATDTEEALAVLRSRQFTEAFIVEKNLMPKFFPNAWDATKKDWKPGIRVPTRAQAFKYFDTRIRSVVEDQKTQLTVLQIHWKDRNEAAQWANELVQRLNAEMRARAISHADASIGYLEHELESTAAVGTREAINRIIEVQIKQRMLANVTQEFAFRVVDPALAPDANDPVKPKKLLMLIAGPLVGFGFGIVFVLGVTWLGRMFGFKWAA
jgi:uncharacterized protein involved in exopolysaccharide biosynthesis